MGSTIGEQLSQGELWFTRPSLDDTPLSLLSQSIKDAVEENLESGFYDAGVLNGLLDLKGFFKTEAHRIEMCSASRPQDAFALSVGEIAKVERLRRQTPDPQAFVVSGLLNAIEHSRKRFQLVLPDGQIIPGRVDETYFGTEELRQFWGHYVTVKGTVYFKPSGKVQLMEAHLIKAMEPGEEIFCRLPHSEIERDLTRSVLREAERRDWIADIWGKWPGDESIEELLEELKTRRSHA